MRSYLVIFAPVFAAGVLTGWVIPWWVRTWRASTVLIAEVKAAADDAVPYPTPAAYLDPIDGLATSLSCTWCRPKPEGHCTCSGKCGHIRCVAPRSLFTDAERAWLDGRKKELPQ